MKPGKVKLPIYLDPQASERISPEVRDAIYRYWAEENGNPHSAHEHGRRAKAAISDALDHVADFIGSLPRELTLVSGATAANNLAIQGIEHLAAEGRHQILVSAIEHPCVLETARFMAANRGFELTVIPVDSQGFLDMNQFEKALSEEVALVSVMLGNNEIGTIQNLSELSLSAHAVGALVHTDATQAAGRIPLDVLDLDCDMLSLSAHKMSGPIGVGALFVKDGIRLHPLIHGGRQQPLASGTMSPELAVGFGAACQTASGHLHSSEQTHLRDLIERFEGGLREAGYTFTKNGPLSDLHRLPGTTHLTFQNFDLSELQAWLAPYVSFSTKSACATENQKISHVLDAVGLSEQKASQSARFSVSHQTTAEEVDMAIRFFADYVEKMTELGAAK
jgi:cysteine desulfurase